MDKKKLIDEIKFILAGIDKDETADPEGWWETRSGANFGAEKLADVIAAIGKA